MRKSVTLSVVAASVALCSATIANDDMAAQLDIIAPLIASGDLNDLGGPATAAELVESIDGRWFTLNNAIRNWPADSGEARDMLSRSIDRLCADDWENIVTFTATGNDRFRIEQRSPNGKDNGTFELVAVAPEERTFTMQLDDDYLIAVYGLENASELQRQNVLTDMREVAEEGAQFWRPVPDLVVNKSPVEVEVWGRCPSQTDL